VEGKGGIWKTMVGFLVLVMGGKGWSKMGFDPVLLIKRGGVLGWFVCWAKKEWWAWVGLVLDLDLVLIIIRVRLV
jgi:hypothetical protein